MLYRQSSIKVQRKDDKIVTIEVLGDLTSSAQKFMEAAYQKACGYNTAGILLNFDGKSRIDSAGIAILIDLAMDGRENGRRIFVTGLSEHLRKVFEFVGLAKYTTIVDSEDEVVSDEIGQSDADRDNE